MLDYQSAPGIPLTRSEFRSANGADKFLSGEASAQFAGARSPAGALTGLALRLQCWDRAHLIAQDLNTVEGSYWHGILHRIEPDGFNAGYWFRKVGRHPIFSILLQQAAPLIQGMWPVPSQWDPSLFIQWCSEARSTGDKARLAAAKSVQMIEWQLLFDHCNSR